MTEKEIKRRLAFYLVDQLELSIFDTKMFLTKIDKDAELKRETRKKLAEYMVFLKLAKADYAEKCGGIK